MHKVSIVKYKDGTTESLQKAIELCEGFKRLHPGDRVVIKPNVIWGGGLLDKVPKFGFMTTSYLVECLILLLKDFGCTNIAIGEGTVEHKELRSTTMGGYKWIGLKEVAKKHQVELLDFNAGPFRKVHIEDTSFEINEYALDCDFLINMPVRKTHYITVISGAMKNLKGCLSTRSKKKFHTGKNLERMIALLNVFLQPDLTIFDGIYSLEKGPTSSGISHRTDVIIAGKDTLACDIVETHSLIGLEADKVEHLKFYSDITGRSLKLEDIEIVGEPLGAIQTHYQYEVDYMNHLYNAQIEGVELQDFGNTLCTGCLSAIEAGVMVICKDNPKQRFDSLEICAGSVVKPMATTQMVFLLGNCAIKNNKNINDKQVIEVKGCPPKLLDMYTRFSKSALSKPRAMKNIGIRAIRTLGTLFGYDENLLMKEFDPKVFSEKHFSQGVKKRVIQNNPN